MQLGVILKITQAKFDPQNQMYIVSDFLLPRLTPNHILPKEQKQTQSILPIGKNVQKVKKKRFIFAEQMLYLTYVAEHQHYLPIEAVATRQEWENNKRRDVITIMQNLSEIGYNKLQFVQFYLKIRKKSKLIERLLHVPDQAIPRPPSFYATYKTVQNFRQKCKGETFLLVQKQQKLSSILKIKEHYYKEKSLKVHILSNLDGITIQLMPSFIIHQQSNIKS